MRRNSEEPMVKYGAVLGGAALLLFVLGTYGIRGTARKIKSAF